MDLQHMENGIGSGGGGGTSGLGEVDFQRLAQTIATSIQKILQNVSTMQRMVSQLNTPQDSPDLNKQLHQILSYTNQLVSDTHNQINEVQKCKERHLKIQKDRLVDEYTGALTAFQAVQRKTADIEKNAIIQARSQNPTISKPPGSNNRNGSGGNNGSFFDRKSNQQQQTQIQEEVDLQALEEQERKIRKLEENIIGVNDIYKKLGAMVYEQGQVVDSIESSVEQTSVFMSQGSENLRIASSYKNKLRKRKLILFGILAVVLLIVILILVFQLKH